MSPLAESKYAITADRRCGLVLKRHRTPCGFEPTRGDCPRCSGPFQSSAIFSHARVLSPHEAYRPCGATLIDQNVWRVRGAMTFRCTGEAFEALYAQPPGYDRPWARELVEVRPAPAPDATPPLENLNADD